MSADQKQKELRRTISLAFLFLAVGVVVLGVAALLRAHKPVGEPKQPSRPDQVEGYARLATSDLGAIPFNCEHDDADQTLQLMRRQALRLARALDNTNHPCNPLGTGKARITGVHVTPLARGNKIYTIWISDGTTTCGLEALHSEGRHPEVFKGDFFTRFFLSDFEGGYCYQKPMFEEAIKPGKKGLRQEAIGEASRDIVEATCGEDFLSNTLPQQYSGFSVSEGCSIGYATRNTSPPSAGDAFTKNVAIATLIRTDMPQVNPYNFSALSKIKVYVQAEPPESSLAFKVVYVDAGNNGFDPTKYGGTGNAPGHTSPPPTAKRLR